MGLSHIARQWTVGKNDRVQPRCLIVALRDALNASGLQVRFNFHLWTRHAQELRRPISAVAAAEDSTSHLVPC